MNLFAKGFCLIGFSAISLSAKTTLDTLPLINLDDFFQSRGNHSYDVWNDLSKSANPNGGSLGDSTYMWPAYNAQISSEPVGERAQLVKLSNAPDGIGGPYFASSSIYFWGGTSSGSSPQSGTLAVRDSNPLAGLKTLTLQLEIGEADGEDLYGLPSLLVTLADSTTVAINMTYAGIIDQVSNGTFEPPNSGLPPQDLYINLWGFQWDLSVYTNISQISVSFTGMKHSQLMGIQLDQSDYNFGSESIFDYLIPVPVPEPTTYALLLSAASLGVMLMRRRKVRQKCARAQ